MTEIGCLKLVMKIITTLCYFSATVWTKDCKAKVWTSAAWWGWELSQEMRREENYPPAPAPAPGCVFTRATLHLILLIHLQDPAIRACTTFKHHQTWFPCLVSGNYHQTWLACLVRTMPGIDRWCLSRGKLLLLRVSGLSACLSSYL